MPDEIEDELINHPGEDDKSVQKRESIIEEFKKTKDGKNLIEKLESYRKEITQKPLKPIFQIDWAIGYSSLFEEDKIDSKTFAFPFDDVGISKETMETMREQTSVEATFGISGIKQDYSPLHIHRVPMEDYNWSASDILTSEYGYHRLKSIFGKNTIHRD